MNIHKNKRGGFFDLIVAIVLSFILVICFVAFMYAQHIVNDKLQEQAPELQGSFSSSTNVSQVINDTVGKVGEAYQSFYWISIVLIVGYFLSILVTSFLVKTHPIWFVGHIFVIIIATIISVYISNTYQTLMMNGILEGTFAGFVGANYIFTYLPIWVVVIGFISGILMYANLDSGVY